MQIENEIKQFILKNLFFAEDNTTLDEDASFLETGVVDSTGVMELVAFVEAEFGVPVGERRSWCKLRFHPQGGPVHPPKRSLPEQNGFAGRDAFDPDAFHRRGALTFSNQ